MPLKRNRKIAVSAANTKQGHYAQLRTLDLKPHTVRAVYLEGVEFPLLLVKHLFVNEDGSAGVLYVVTSDTNLAYSDITAIYRKRWNVEPYHKSLKQNASLERSLIHTVTTQPNHFFAALDGYIKLERLKLKTKRNHFALKATLYAPHCTEHSTRCKSFRRCWGRNLLRTHV